VEEVIFGSKCLLELNEKNKKEKELWEEKKNEEEDAEKEQKWKKINKEEDAEKEI